MPLPLSVSWLSVIRGSDQHLLGGGEASLTPGSPPPTATPPHRPPSAQVYTVVDEMFLAGEIRETSQTKVLKQLLMLQSLE